MSHAGSWLVAALAAGGLGVRSWRRLETHPYARCLWCLRHGGLRPGSRPDSYGFCKHCRGSRLRPGMRGDR
jgi:hypothetical protein